ncbi:alpha/beta fold hydrolase [Ktedonobacter racemifer]|uniref:Alpha/beta hydrolase fold protein n=1 Tax=Ktedonobacter racemifer DSM 44963 TaxID=485913 RepID=D6TJ02_KTERA|nr:alpha/beta hydrolase [Ktedonobacter racemifer]EFH89409.1 alpha/beta hydrolase fold protein [Ktedonobacter racemifer DSM 44963]
MQTVPRPLVFIHGSGDNAQIWDTLLPYFQQQGQHPAYALDLPGHGKRTDTLTATASVADYAREVAHILSNERHLSSAIIIGHSLGGAIALTLALEYPQMLSGLVLIGSGARLRVHPTLLEEAQHQPDRAAERLTALALAPSSSASMVPRLLQQKGANDMQMLYRDLVACNSFDVMEHIPEITLPTCLLCGEDDQLTPPKYSRYLQQQLAHASLQVLPAAGHYVMCEQPEATYQVLSLWLQEIEGTA